VWVPVLEIVHNRLILWTFPHKATYSSLKKEAIAEASSTMAFSKAIASMMIEIPLAEHNRFQDFLPF
jgi:hypothetical protein